MPPTRTFELLAAAAGLVAALGAITHWVLWFTYHERHGFKGIRDREAIGYARAHPTVWRVMALANTTSIVAVAVLWFVAFQFLSGHSPLWAQAFGALAVLSVLTGLGEVSATAGLVPWVAERLGPDHPDTDRAVIALLLIYWHHFWVATLVNGGAMLILCGVGLANGLLPALWCALGIVVAVSGFVSLQGAKALRIVHGAGSIVLLLWLAAIVVVGGIGWAPPVP